MPLNQETERERITSIIEHVDGNKGYVTNTGLATRPARRLGSRLLSYGNGFVDEIGGVPQRFPNTVIHLQCSS